MLKIEDFIDLKFRHSHHCKDLNYDILYKSNKIKGLEVKVVLQWGEAEGHYYDIPTTWIIRGNYTIFNGKIDTAENLGLVIKMLQI